MHLIFSWKANCNLDALIAKRLRDGLSRYHRLTNYLMTPWRILWSVIRVVTTDPCSSGSQKAKKVACENIRFPSLFAAGDVSRGGTRKRPHRRRARRNGCFRRLRKKACESWKLSIDCCTQYSLDTANWLFAYQLITVPKGRRGGGVRSPIVSVLGALTLFYCRDRVGLRRDENYPWISEIVRG